jgi:hypothetical protein
MNQRKSDEDIRNSYNSLNLTPEKIAGFVDAEGNFYFQLTPNKTSKLGKKISLSFNITQTQGEVQILEELKKSFNCGSITGEIKPRLNSS